MFKTLEIELFARGTSRNEQGRRTTLRLAPTAILGFQLNESARLRTCTLHVMVAGVHYGMIEVDVWSLCDMAPMDEADRSAPPKPGEIEAQEARDAKAWEQLQRDARKAYDELTTAWGKRMNLMEG